jgi:hypothetical protein
MVIICEKCGDCFKSLCYYNRNKNKKFPCVVEERDKLDIENRTCLHCKHVFGEPYMLRDHLLICKHIPLSEADELKQLILKLTETNNQQINQLKEINNQQFEELKKTINKQQKIINNNTINVQQNIIVTPFGKEDLSFLTLKDYTKIFNKGCYSIPEIVKLIHCNEDKPEFMNVYIKNFKDEYMFTFDGKDWDIEKKDDVLNNMIENKKNLLESKFDDMQDSLPQYAINMFKKFLERSDNNEVKNSIKDELKNMFYKNRNCVSKFKKPKIKQIHDKPVDITIIANDDNDYICETNLIALSNESKKPLLEKKTN